MTVLFMDVSFVIGCVDQICQSFLSECVFFFNHRFWLCHYGFLTFLCLWEISFTRDWS